VIEGLVTQVHVCTASTEAILIELVIMAKFKSASDETWTTTGKVERGADGRGFVGLSCPCRVGNGK